MTRASAQLGVLHERSLSLHVPQETGGRVPERAPRDHVVDLAVLAVLVQYLASSLSLVRLATTRNQRLLGVASAAISIGFALECQPIEGLVLAGLLAVGGAVALTTRRALAREESPP